ncbi:hypothetical protein M3J09_003553 [Ascochyta lentis]
MIRNLNRRVAETLEAASVNFKLTQETIERSKRGHAEFQRYLADNARKLQEDEEWLEEVMKEVEAYKERRTRAAEARDCPEHTPSHLFTIGGSVNAVAERASRRDGVDRLRSQVSLCSVAKYPSQGLQKSGSDHVPSSFGSIPSLPHPRMFPRASRQGSNKTPIHQSSSVGVADLRQHHQQQYSSQPLHQQLSDPVFQSRPDQFTGHLGQQTQQGNPQSWNSTFGQPSQYALGQGLSSPIAPNCEQPSTTAFGKSTLPGTIPFAQNALQLATTTAFGQNAAYTGPTGASRNSPCISFPHRTGSAAQSQGFNPGPPKEEYGKARSKKSGVARPRSPVKNEIPPLPELDSFAWSEAASAWVSLSGLDVRVRVAMTDNTASLGEDDRYAEHYWGLGDRCNGVCTGCKHKHRNGAWCDEISLLDTLHACAFCCDTSTQPCGTLIPHPDPSPNGDKYAIGYLPLPLHMRSSDVSWAQYRYWVPIVHPEDRPSNRVEVIHRRKSILQRGVAKVGRMFRRSSKTL